MRWSWTVIRARKRASAFVLAMVAMLAAGAWSAQPVCADVVVGNGTPESCTEQALGTAIAQGGNIRFSCGVSPTVIVLTASWVVLQDTTIDGGGMITLSGGDTTELLVNTAVLNLLNLTIIHGRISTDQGAGGAVVNVNALNVVNSVFSENRSALLGGAIKNKGTLTVSRSTFSSNTAPVGGAISNDGICTVRDSTFVGNQSSETTASGGAIDNWGTLDIVNSTFARNGLMGGGGAVETHDGTHVTITNSTFWGNSLDAVSNYGALALTLTNTILARSDWENCTNTVTDGGHNLEDGYTCAFGAANGSLGNVDAMLDPVGLANNGGSTQTIALLPGSPAINAGNKAICAGSLVNDLDQRGFVRPGVGAASCSIGAYEYNAVPPCVGDCGGIRMVVVSDIITMLDIALGNAPIGQCPAGDADHDGTIDVSEIVAAVNTTLNGCPA